MAEPTRRERRRWERRLRREFREAQQTGVYVISGEIADANPPSASLYPATHDA